ncbi:sulfatase-like hydrolase/transferase [Lentisphaera profundi]|uniref:Sulfatase-like hydrolase/transferase n=1 Tax=Lentisphaera profundi TaxID=1658616 RepID=A0ABY7VZ79_9BACT|nr:sulfatase-like hydrolase/transferase [Lentisphaera profundi]WDE98172.1 sulfatase-like hydrolase/transferase [Lentisphaera profundi]
MHKLVLVFFALIGTQAWSLEKPNILWLTSEDNNVTHIGCYGNEVAITPNIDKLATEGFRYTHAYSNAAVCSATRTSWITGMNAVSMAGHNHRSNVAVPQDKVIFYPQQLKKAGYFTGNHTKRDYNTRDDSRLKTLWDSNKLNWESLKKNQPFFQVINHTDSHESRAMGLDHTYPKDKVQIPPYHPDTADTRANYGYYYKNVTKMDRGIGVALAKLEELGLVENTIVIYNSDHGGPLPRGKRYMYNSGTHCPLIVRIPEKYKELWPADKPGMTVDRLVSFIDMPSTWLSLAGAKIPSNYQGEIFLGAEKTAEPEYIFHFRGRNDGKIENARAIRDKQFLYVRNYMPYVPRGQHLPYQWKIPMQREWEQAYKDGKLNANQSRFFKTKAKDELFDVSKDSFCLNNLAQSPEYKQIVETMKKKLDSAQQAHLDSGLIPESELNHRASKNGITPYEVVRNKELYDLDAYMQAAAVALEQKTEFYAELQELLKSPDSGVRHWALCGLFMLRAQVDVVEDVEPLLNDPSETVRAMAAWTLIEINQSAEAYKVFENLLQSDTYAELEILNYIDWMGANNKRLIPFVKNYKIKDGKLKPFHDYLVNGMPPLGPKKKSKKIKNKKGKS